MYIAQRRVRMRYNAAQRIGRKVPAKRRGLQHGDADKDSVGY
jgi:hypothetical protein